VAREIVVHKGEVPKVMVVCSRCAQPYTSRLPPKEAARTGRIGAQMLYQID